MVNEGNIAKTVDLEELQMYFKMMRVRDSILQSWHVSRLIIPADCSREMMFMFKIIQKI